MTDPYPIIDYPAAARAFEAWCASERGQQVARDRYHGTDPELATAVERERLFAAFYWGFKAGVMSNPEGCEPSPRSISIELTPNELGVLNRIRRWQEESALSKVRLGQRCEPEGGVP